MLVTFDLAFLCLYRSKIWIVNYYGLHVGNIVHCYSGFMAVDSSIPFSAIDCAYWLDFLIRQLQLKTCNLNASFAMYATLTLPHLKDHHVPASLALTQDHHHSLPSLCIINLIPVTIS